jgi:hypothetical protein
MSIIQNMMAADSVVWCTSKQDLSLQKNVIVHASLALIFICCKIQINYIAKLINGMDVIILGH